MVVPEVSGGMWKEETLKTITGGDAIPVQLHEAMDFFRGQAGVYAMGEHATRRQPFAWWTTQSRRRIRIWPFTHKPDKVDPRLGEKLQEPAMLGNVLQWALRGAAMYARLEGELQDCDAVLEATSDYFSDVDTIAAWLEAATSEAHIPEHDTGAAACYKHYSAWCDAEGQRPSSRTAWGISMGRRMERRRGKRGHVYPIELDALADGVGLTNGSRPNPTPHVDPDLATKQGRL